MPSSLPRDSTLRTIVDSLSDPDRFVSKAFGVMHVEAKKHGNVMLRLGITGTGQLPNYRIEDAAGNPIEAFDGNTHNRWPDGSVFTASETWSRQAISKAEVETLLGELRGFSRS